MHGLNVRMIWRKARSRPCKNGRPQFVWVALSAVRRLKQPRDHLGDRKINTPRADFGHCRLQNPMKAFQLIRTVTVDFHCVASSLKSHRLAIVPMHGNRRIEISPGPVNMW